MDSTAAETNEGNTTMNLYQRISKIQKGVTRVDKSADVGGKYKAVTHDDVTKMLRPLMVEFGVVAYITPARTMMVDTGVVWSGRPLFQMQGQYKMTFVNIDDPTDTLSITVEAHADDSGDKAPGKCTSYAYKYGLMKTFMVTTGEDEEQRIVPEEPCLSDAHYAALYEKAEEIVGDDAANVLSSMATKVFLVPTAADILDKHFEVAMRKLETKAEQSEEK